MLWFMVEKMHATAFGLVKSKIRLRQLVMPQHGDVPCSKHGRRSQIGKLQLNHEAYHTKAIKGIKLWDNPQRLMQFIL
jgi:hypothetical protein